MMILHKALDETTNTHSELVRMDDDYFLTTWKGSVPDVKHTGGSLKRSEVRRWLIGQGMDLDQVRWLTSKEWIAANPMGPNPMEPMPIINTGAVEALQVAMDNAAGHLRVCFVGDDCQRLDPFLPDQSATHVTMNGGAIQVNTHNKRVPKSRLCDAEVSALAERMREVVWTGMINVFVPEHQRSYAITSTHANGQWIYLHAFVEQ